MHDNSPPFTPKIGNREEGRSINAFRPRLLYSTIVSTIIGVSAVFTHEFPLLTNYFNNYSPSLHGAH